ncbi:MAG: hypothetical protein PVF37_12365 [Desulfobacterales bacterium]|jgi:hypothetical protein
MNVDLKKFAVFLIIAVYIVFMDSFLYAYVLQGPHVLDLTVKNLGNAKSLYVAHKIVFYRSDPIDDSRRTFPGSESNQPQDAYHRTDDSNLIPDIIDDEIKMETEPMELEGSLRFIFSQAFRSDTRSNDSERVFIFAEGKTLTLIDGNRIPGAENRFDLFKDPLLYHTREGLVERLLQLGVDVSISSLGRFEEKIAFVIGAQYPDETVSQIWVDQDTFLPLRLIIKGFNPTGELDTFEFRYHVWWKIGKTRYPSRIEFYQDGNLVRVNQALNFEENASFSEELFDIDYLKTVFNQAPLQPIVPGEPEEPSEVEKTIEEFRRIFE